MHKWIKLDIFSYNVYPTKIYTGSELLYLMYIFSVGFQTSCLLEEQSTTFVDG